MCLLRTLYHYYYYFITIIIIIILYLKSFNKCIPYQHFKMDTLKTVLNLIAKDCSLASLDLKVAYYSISNYRKYLWFLWRGQHNQFTCSPYGLSSCPTKFTDLIKPSITAVIVQLTYHLITSMTLSSKAKRTLIVYAMQFLLFLN